MTRKIVIFGASGDLAIKKLIPNIAKLNDPEIEVIVYTRSTLDEKYLEKLKMYHDYEESFLKRISYFQGHYHDLSSLIPVTDENTVLYFSVPPSVYEDLLNETSKLRYKAIGIEKPFGVDFKSFQSLSCFNDSRIHFIDHYLLKNLSIILPEVLSKNHNLRNFISKQTVKSVEAKFHESILAEGRAFFDKTGMMKDVMQNHLVEIIATILCERDSKADKNELWKFVANNLNESSRRAEIIKNMSIVEDSGIFGQYEEYTEELGVPSTTETFAAFLVHVNVSEWQNIPFILSAGKGLSEKTTEVTFNIQPKFFEKAISQILGDKQLFLMKKKLKEIKLTYQFSPKSAIFLKILSDTLWKKYPILQTDQIDQYVGRIFNENRGYQIIFDSLVYSKEFPNAKHIEVYEMWRMFEKISDDHKSTFFYKTGIHFPEEATEHLKKLY